MRITHMVVQNFLSFGKAEFDFRDQGLVLVEGENCDDKSAKSNGSGKSAMIDALVWCLFGTTLRGYENDEVVNRKVGEDCEVTVSLEDGDEIYAIARHRRHSKFKNALRVVHSNFDEDMTLSSNTETQEVVERLLGCTVSTFLSSVVFGQDNAYRFSSLTDKEQKDILDEVLGVERFSVACAAARVKVNLIEARRIQVQRDLDKAEEARDAASDEIEELTEKDEHYSAEFAEKLMAEKEKLAKAEEWIKKNADADTSKQQVLVDKALKHVVAMEKAVAVCSKEVTDAKIMRARAKDKVDEFREHVKRHESLSGDCPTCGQKIDGMQRDRVVDDFKKKLTPAVNALKKVDIAVTEIADQLTDAEKKLAEARKLATTAQKALNDAVAEGANLISWRRRAADCRTRIAEIEKENNPYTMLLKKAKARRDKSDAEAKLLTEQLAVEEGQLELASFWVTAFGARGLRSLLLDSSLPLLNEEASRVSRAVTGGAISIEFSATSDLKSGKTIDRFEVRVDNKHGAASYLGNSAGEKAKVDLCVGLALQRLVASRSSASFNVMFADEIFDHLDEAAHERVVDVLSEIDKESVFVVSHNEDLRAWFPNVLTIRKKKGFSTVEQ